MPLQRLCAGEGDDVVQRADDRSLELQAGAVGDGVWPGRTEFGLLAFGLAQHRTPVVGDPVQPGEQADVEDEVRDAGERGVAPGGPVGADDALHEPEQAHDDKRRQQAAGDDVRVDVDHAPTLIQPEQSIGHGRFYARLRVSSGRRAGGPRSSSGTRVRPSGGGGRGSGRRR